MLRRASELLCDASRLRLFLACNVIRYRMDDAEPGCEEYAIVVRRHSYGDSIAISSAEDLLRSQVLQVL